MIACYSACNVSYIAVTGDMVPTTVFGWTVMLRSGGLQTCTRDDVVLTHQFVAVLATIEECHLRVCL